MKIIERLPEDHPSGARERVTAYLDGAKTATFYTIGDQRHRLDGPAAIFYYEDGSVAERQWWRKGNMHREGGPALIQYDYDGSVFLCQFWRHGRQIIGGEAQ